ncbi:MAG: hypothetical protein ACRD2Z_13370 [Thermoanaerobaculia bacterium]
MTSPKRTSDTLAVCLSLLGSAGAFGSVATGAAVGPPAAPTIRVVESADGRPFFTQAGTHLLLQVQGAEPVEIDLPGAMDVVTAARHDDAVWVAGRVDFAEVRSVFIAEVKPDGSLSPLPVPADREHMRTFPTLLADGGRVGGMVWQEGDRQEDNSIRAAAWLGEAWGPVETVSPARGSEQTGLTATVLADGSWLAVWAAVDDEDDLWWSRRRGDTWSEPRRVFADNQVPDILPRLAPTRDGALLAWTAYDGNDYRLRLAVLDGDSWVERPLAGGRGAEPVRWLALSDGLALLHGSVEPEVWSVVRLDAAGRVLGRHAATPARSEEPMVVERGSDLLLRWPTAAGEEAGAEVRMAPAREPEE